MDTDRPYASRGGLKLAAALDAFALDVTGRICADLGCSTGGFTDCLRRRGAAHVYAVDTAYGQLAWTLRQDPQVTVLERTNAVHLDPWQTVDGFAGCDLVVIDLGWTRQERALPAALRWLRRESSEARAGARIITLIKPHYESQGRAMQGGRGGVLSDAEAEAVLTQVLSELPAMGVEVLGCIPSPIRGGKGGNLEHLALLRVAGGR